MPRKTALEAVRAEQFSPASMRPRPDAAENPAVTGRGPRSRALLQ